MKVVKKDGKHYLVGKAAEVGRALTKSAKDSLPLDLGWSLSKQADDASELSGEKYQCSDCGFAGHEGKFVGGGCPECGGKKTAKA